MKITGTNSYIQIETDERVVRFSGERIVGGFIAFKSSAVLVNGMPLDAQAISDIIDAVTLKTKSSHMVIVFE